MVLVVISTLVACVLTSSLAALLVVAERYLANYGSCRIDVNAAAKVIEVQGGDSLLMALRAGGIFIPSACGGRGTCAYCKVKVLSGLGPVGPTEQPMLSGDEIASDIRISCQCKVRNDLAVEIPRTLLEVKAYTGVVRQIRDLTRDIKELRIRLTDPPTIDFVPGQYVQLEVPAYGDSRESMFRAYSLSSTPSDEGWIELIIRLVPGGICTTWLFTVLAEGQKVTFTGPFGSFHLSQENTEMIWIAGGSGMAPFWSMIRQMKQTGNARPCTYFFGAVERRDTFFLDELRTMERQLEWFTFIPALSGEADDDWTGERGLITEVVDRHVSEGSAAEAYLCGGPGMIDAAIKILRTKGFTDDRIYFDKFE